MTGEHKRQEDNIGQMSSAGSSGPRAASAHHSRSHSDRREANILGLPRKIRARIYQTVLYVPHPLYLFQDTGTKVETFAPERPNRWLSLLQVNRQIHEEAAEVLFGMNNFTLLDERQPQDLLLKAFLTCIGPVNSALLTHLSMDFPTLEGPLGEVKLKDDSLRRLKLLKSHCTNLTTLETSFSVKHAKDLVQVAGDSPQSVNEALSQVNLQLQTIPSLKTTIVRITGPQPAPSTLECMRSLGWTTLPAYGH